MYIDEFLDACRTIVEPYYRIQWNDATKSIIPDQEANQPESLYFARLLEAMNRVIGILTDDSVVNSRNREHYLNATVPDMVVSLLLAREDRLSEILGFLRSMKQVSSYSYENRKARLGFILAPTVSIDEIRSYLNKRHIVFLEVPDPQPLTDSFLRSSKQSYVLADGRVMAYVLDGRGQIIGVAKKLGRSREVGEEIYSDVERRIDSMSTLSWWLMSMRDYFMSQTDDQMAGFPEFLYTFYREMLLKFDANRIRQDMYQDSPQMVFGFVYDGQLQCHLGPRTFIRWEGGGWKFRDGALLQAMVATHLLQAELAAKNFAPMLELIQQLITPNEILKSVEEMVQSGGLPETLTDIVSGPMVEEMQKDFDEDPGLHQAMRKWMEPVRPLSPSQASREEVPEALQPLFDLIIELTDGPASDMVSDEDSNQDYGVDQLLAISESLCDLVLDLSAVRTGAIIVVCQPAYTYGVIEKCTQKTFELHRIFLAPNEEREKYSIAEADKYFLRKVASMDGAILVNSHGVLEDFGLMVTNLTDAGRPLEGARTLASKSLSLFEGVNFVLKVSEDGPISLFRGGQLIFDLQ